MNNIRASFTAADSLPLKIFLNKKLMKGILQKKKILPIHLQLCPTNKCLLHCLYCSCSNEDRKLELSYEAIINLMKTAKRLGCQSVTITGGGEPLLHPNIEEVIWKIHRLKIKIGLVTNGLLLHKLHKPTLDCITWCRVSFDDYRDFNFKGRLEEAIIRGKNIDWAWSYIVTEHPNIEKMKQIIGFANDHNFTHIRLVPNLLELEKVDLRFIENTLKAEDVDDSKVIYQSRNDFIEGTKECYISLLKPIIGADGGIWGCCGVQYLGKKPTRKYPDGMRMGSIDDFEGIVRGQKYFDGSQCDKCYYYNYNRILRDLLGKIEHQEFV